MAESEDRSPEQALPKRMSELFLLHYFTLVAIIEGVALIMTIEHLVGPVSSHELKFRQWLEILPYGITSFVIIIITTFQYAIFLVLFRWKIRVADTVFPYLLGFFQAAQTFFFDSPLIWWGLFVPLSAIGWITLLFTRNHVNDSYFLAHHRAKVKQGINRIISVLVCSTALPVIVFLLIWGNIIPEKDAWWFLLVPVILTYFFLKFVLKGFEEIKLMLDQANKTHPLT